MIKLDISDKQVNEILSKVNGARDLESRYWTEINFTYNENGKDIHTQLFPTSPFLAAGEKVLWRVGKTSGVFSKHAEWIQALTNFRVLEYNFQTHGSKAVALPSVDDIIVANKRTESNSIYSGTHNYRTRTTKSSTFGDIVFISEGRPVITFHQAVDPDAVVEIAKSARQQAMKTKMTNPAIAPEEVTKLEANPALTTNKETLCKSCGSPNSPLSCFCGQCGAKLDFFCPGCGNPNTAGSLFCNQCGFSLK
jgi:hypothetical protein